MLKLDEDGFGGGRLCAWKIHGRIKRSLRVRSYQEVQYIDFSIERQPGWFTLVLDMEVDTLALHEKHLARHLRF